MAKRSITDAEIALIKAMLGRNMKNSDIQLYFNRPDRKVNSGRITGIADGSYSNSKAIAPASTTELDAFLVNPSSAVNNLGQQYDPLGQSTIEANFGKGSDGIWRLLRGETDRCECKANFGFKHQDKWLRPIAALANNTAAFCSSGSTTRTPKVRKAKTGATQSAG